jgi:signal transduction histidine kinase/DNA-binding response OmpR family regulator
LGFNEAGGWVRPAGAIGFRRIKNYPARPIACVANDFDSEGNLWLVQAQSKTHQRMIARVSTEGGDLVWQPFSVEGLGEIGSPRTIFAEQNPAAKTTLWIGGTRSVLYHVVEATTTAPQLQAPLLFASARVENAASFKPINGTLPYLTDAVMFELAQTQFARRSSLRLETRIDGIDPDWVPAGATSKRELTAVRDGHYTLHARAVAETGVASEVTTFSFSVAPPWWRTVPALVGVVLALAPASYGVYRLRLRALRRRTLELEAKVRQRTEQLEQANAAKTQFVANMSHDIRNPLNGIVGLALALEDSKLDPRQREIVATLRECTTYLSSLVDDVLDFASIEAGRVELRPGPFVPAELLRSIVTALKADTAESGAQLIVDVDPALPANLSGDAGRIQQILVNYVSNALKYAGGTIHLTATIPLRSPDEVEFSVTDEGPGISVAEQATLFTKFTRLAAAREHEAPGTGLGLAACRLLADIMSGSVGVESEPGHGARFFLRLPLAAATAASVPADGDLPNTSVLLVEDTDYNALAATAVLRRLGLSCERARNGAEALQLFAAKRFNLVLLDRNLPDMDGTEIARHMRKLEADGPPSVILAVTAYCTADDRTLCLESGMDAFVGKPLTPEKLRRVLLAAANKMLASATLDAAPERAAPPSAAAVDLSLLSYLSDGTTVGLETQIGRFVASLAETQTQLLQSARAGDYPEMATNAHRILGQARMVGATSLSSTVTELELAARLADEARCLDLLRDVDREIESLTATLRRRRSGALTS